MDGWMGGMEGERAWVLGERGLARGWRCGAGEEGWDFFLYIIFALGRGGRRDGEGEVRNGLVLK